MAYTPIPIGSLGWGAPVNAAFTSQDARITALETEMSSGITIPDNWGQFWRPKRDNAAAAPAKVMLIGDSITHGFYSSNLKTTSWAGRIRTTLQTAYGSGGSGMFSTSSTNEVSPPSAPVLAQWQANGSYATTTGTWTSGILFGPGITHIRSTNAATVTFTGVTGTSVRLWYITGGAPRAAWTYEIDGGGPVAVPAVVGGTTIANIDVTGLANTAHTVVITWNGVAGDVLDIIGVAGFNANGVIVDNLGRSGTNTTQWSNASLLTSDWNGGPQNPADLLVIGLGINDAIFTTNDSETWTTNMTNFLQSVKLSNNGATDLIFMVHHFGSSIDVHQYGNYASRIYDLAQNYNAAVINMWALGRNSWDYWNTLGFWGDSNNAGPAGTNTVHPSDAGHQFIADTLTPLLTS